MESTDCFLMFDKYSIGYIHILTLGVYKWHERDATVRMTYHYQNVGSENKKNKPKGLHIYISNMSIANIVTSHKMWIDVNIGTVLLDGFIMIMMIDFNLLQIKSFI